MQALLDHRQLYRLPWSLPDNSISWLEPTAACNLACFGCYRANDPKNHKSLELIDHELDVFTRLRTADGISVAGGDPLCHPEIVSIVANISNRDIKPILNTNGLALSRELLGELKQAGLWGLTLHIDSKQNRPGWKNKSEIETNDLRLEFAELIAGVGDLSCSFNSTVYEDTLPEVPDLVEWAHNHIDIVNVMVFIAFRAGLVGHDLQYHLGGNDIELDTVYSTTEFGRYDIQSTEVLATVQERFPDFQPSAYLNGTARPDSFKWLLTGRIGTKEKIYGYVGPKFMELAQTTHHLRRGRYLAYAHPRTLRHGRSMMLLSAVDPGVAGAAGAWLRTLLTRPDRALGRAHFQSIMMIQPVDMLPDGRQDMCDSCPDQTVWQDRLVWSCRLEEPLQYGDFLSTRPIDRSESGGH
ncbi:MAG: radical SAM protein [Gemmatimonadetes bacterium]|nr:radical SAM protein [Gemmatimonadota bacterium]